MLRERRLKEEKERDRKRKEKERELQTREEKCYLNELMADSC